MGKFTGILLASDFDNTLVYTEEALRTGRPVPPMPERNREALEYFMAEGGRFSIATGRATARPCTISRRKPIWPPRFWTARLWPGARRFWTAFPTPRWRPITSAT